MNHDEPSRGMRGRGPRGHRRTDARIREDVCDRLTDAREVDASDLEVEVQDGEVSLKGLVLDRGMRRRAEEIAEAVGGVEHVRNEIRVRPQGRSELSAGYGTPVAAAYGLDAQAEPARQQVEPPQLASQEAAPQQVGSAHPPPEEPATAAAPASGENSRTVVALFDSPDDAERALAQLDAAGHERTSVSVTRGGGSGSSGGGGAGSDPAAGEQGGGFFGALKSLFVPDADRDAYAEGLRRGGALVSAVVGEGRADEVVGILQRSGAVDLDARRGEWRATGWREYEPLPPEPGRPT